MKKIDSTTRAWIRNAADERAADNGCRFNAARGEHVLKFAEKFCRLYEGDCAGQPLIPHDWQIDVTMRLFGWVRFSERWQREVRRFVQASIWIPKKNKKSPTLAWWGLYLLIADNEPGQKVFSAAKDGTQARISHNHAIEMVRQSEELSSECSINKTTFQITHEPSRSVYSILSSDNSSAQKAKEGINGSILIDEVHVVDRAFVKRISRAGISRSEPMQLEVSTAGNDAESYGKERFDYGASVEQGLVVDERLFYAAFAAPQTLSDDELATDPIKFGKLANPAWGHTIAEEEYLDDFNRSRKSISDLADFKMYRLNVWQQASNPWLSMSDWAACKRDYTYDELRGQPCYIGLDLAKVYDFTAATLVFPWGDGEFRLLPFFWMPEETAQKRGHLASYSQWAHDGHIKLTPGAVCDYGFVMAQLDRLAKDFDICELAYDPWQAEKETQEFEQGRVDDKGNTIFEGTGIPRYKFDQNIKNFAEPTAEFERLICGHKIHHNGHPVLTWQAGHAKVRSDYNGNKRVVKPKPGDFRTVDAVVAAIMAFSRARGHTSAPQWGILA